MSGITLQKSSPPLLRASIRPPDPALPLLFYRNLPEQSHNGEVGLGWVLLKGCCDGEAYVCEGSYLGMGC